MVYLLVGSFVLWSVAFLAREHFGRKWRASVIEALVATRGGLEDAERRLDELEELCESKSAG